MPRRLALGLAAARIASGAVGLVAPRFLHRLSGLDSDASPTAVAYTRYFATRAIALGVGYLLANGSTRHHLDRIGLIADGGDTLFAAAMVSRGSLPVRAAAWLMAATGSATAIDIANVRAARISTTRPCVSYFNATCGSRSQV